jgi:hypothetical protein
MTKPTITRLFVGSLIAIVGGVVLLLAGVLAAVASGALVTSGSEVTGFEPSAVGWTTVGFVLVGVLVTIGGAIGQFVAWIGAVVNTSRLDDKLWFILLLVLGLMSFGLIAMLVYVLAGPDGTQPQVRRSQPA